MVRRLFFSPAPKEIESLTVRNYKMTDALVLQWSEGNLPMYARSRRHVLRSIHRSYENTIMNLPTIPHDPPKTEIEEKSHTQEQAENYD